MKVLFVTPCLSTPPRHGAQRRIHGLMEQVAQRHEVTVLSFVDPRESHAEQLLETRRLCREVVTVPNFRAAISGVPKRLLQLGTVVSPHSYWSFIARANAMQSALNRVVSGRRFDVIQVEFPSCAAYDFSAAVGRPRLCLDQHNIEYDVRRRTAEMDVGLVRRAYSAIDWRKLRREEHRAWRRFHGCIVASERDGELLRRDVPRARTAVVPNGVDTDAFAPMPELGTEPDTVLFFGALSYHPNTDGLLFFLREAWPLLKARRPGVKLRIVGPTPPPSIASWPDPSVEVVGYVDDIRPHIARAAVVVVPLRIGGGTRLKILEAMALGKAIVSTTLGAEGIDVTHEREILVADDGVALATQIDRVLSDDVLSRRLGAAARELAVERYSWRSSAERLTRFYEELQPVASWSG